ncbi:MAG: hypothetical protein A2V66_00595 [Ignavibacteria bacterium RBG_13_36_8]|nr:MAG: hypothetical protein A2V66_00595 [Ignavibacteria bacterium RBG_13_36_8]
METIFIGTGSGKTSLSRHHSSFLIKTKNHSLLIDSGDGVSRALLSQGVDARKIDSILLTHYHSDHFSGLPALITQMKLLERESELNIYTHTSLIAPLKIFLHNTYIFPGILKFNINIVGFEFGAVCPIDSQLNFTTRQNSHISNKHNLIYSDVSFVSGSVLVTTEGKNLFYTSDIGSEDDLYLFREKQIDFFISETTHIPIEKIYQAFIKSGAKSLYLTHIDEKDEELLKVWYRKLNQPKNIYLTYDGLTIKS